MGIPFDGSQYTEPGISIPEIFPDTTPKYLFVSFTGIAIGEYWAPGMPGPGNGVYCLHQDEETPSRWYNESETDYCQFQYAYGRTYLILMAGIALYGRFADSNIIGDWHYENNKTTWAGWAYWGGGAQIAWSKGLASPCFEEIAALINQSQSVDTFTDFWPMDSTHMVQRFCNQKESTNIKIKYDFT